MRYRRIVVLIAAPNALPLLAVQAQEQAQPDEAKSMLWKNAPLTIQQSKTVSRLDFTNAANQQIGLLGELKKWRDTFRGSGGTSKRELLTANMNGYKMGMNFGQVALPGISGLAASGDSASGLSASFANSALGTVEIGTTYRPRAVAEMLAEYDSTMTGTDVALAQATTMNYLRATPVLSKTASLELSAMQASREDVVGTEKAWRRGSFLGGKGKIQFGRNWLASGEWVRADLDQKDAHQKWNVNSNGPIAHPFGEAKAEILYQKSEAGFADFASEDVNGQSLGQAKITQDVKKGELSGQIQVMANERERERIDNIVVGDEVKARLTTSNANFNLKVTPNLSLRALGNVSTLQSEKSLVAASGNPVTDDQFALDQITQSGGDFGLEWKFSKALRMSATTGFSQSDSWRRLPAVDDTETSNWQRMQNGDENRYGLELQHQIKAGKLGLKYQIRDRDNSEVADAENDFRNIEAIRLEAERDLIAGLHVKTMLDFARDRDNPWSRQESLARRAEAQISLNKMARLDLRMRDGAALPGDLLSDALGSPFGSIASRAFQTGDREFAARFNAGSAQNGKGLGFAFEYARNKTGNENLDTWKVGLTFK